jgi:predicted nucleotidyltransferase
MSMSLKRFKEGDFVETRHGMIFDVKGLIHPPDKVIAFLRYYPSETGERTRNGVKYQKVYSLHERYNILMRTCPTYVYFDKVYDSIMQGVPLGDVALLHEPTKKLAEISGSRQNLDAFKNDSLEFCNILSESADVPLSKLGLSGSILVDLHTSSSDIDVIVYGSSNCLAVYEGIGSLYVKSNSPVRPYNEDELRKLFKFRSSDTFTEWDPFLKTEGRKRLQGVFKNREYFVRFVKDQNEVKETYGEVIYKSLGRTTIKGRVTNDDEALFTPCAYKITNIEIIEGEGEEITTIDEISSFRGRFCEVAKKGERVVARGKLELVRDKSGREHHRVLIGGEKEDFLTLT